jgi:hypothetical protein
MSRRVGPAHLGHLQAGQRSNPSGPDPVEFANSCAARYWWDESSAHSAGVARFRAARRRRDCDHVCRGPEPKRQSRAQQVAARRRLRGAAQPALSRVVGRFDAVGVGEGPMGGPVLEQVVGEEAVVLRFRALSHEARSGLPKDRRADKAERPTAVGFRFGVEGLRGVYVHVVPGLRSPSRVSTFFGLMGLSATTRDLSRHPVNARNEGVRGSNPRVGFPICSAACGSRPVGVVSTSCRMARAVEFAAAAALLAILAVVDPAVASAPARPVFGDWEDVRPHGLPLAFVLGSGNRRIVVSGLAVGFPLNRPGKPTSIVAVAYKSGRHGGPGSPPGVACRAGSRTTCWSRATTRVGSRPRRLSSSTALSSHRAGRCSRLGLAERPEATAAGPQRGSRGTCAPAPRGGRRRHLVHRARRHRNGDRQGRRGGTDRSSIRSVTGPHPIPAPSHPIRRDSCA